MVQHRIGRLTLIRTRERKFTVRISEIFGLGSPGEDWCRNQRDQAEQAGADISEMDCAVDGTHYPDSRSPNAAQWD